MIPGGSAQLVGAAVARALDIAQRRPSKTKELAAEDAHLAATVLVSADAIGVPQPEHRSTFPRLRVTVFVVAMIRTAILTMESLVWIV